MDGEEEGEYLNIIGENWWANFEKDEFHIIQFIDDGTTRDITWCPAATFGRYVNLHEMFINEFMLCQYQYEQAKADENQATIAELERKFGFRHERTDTEIRQNYEDRIRHLWNNKNENQTNSA